MNIRLGDSKKSFVLPSLVVMLGIIIVPMFFALWIIFNDVNLLENQGKFVFVGLKNFKTLASDTRFWNSIWVTLRFLILSLVIEIVLSMAISLLIDRKFPCKSIIRPLLYVPMFMTPVVSGLIWRAFFDPNAGIISYLCQKMAGKGIDFLGNTNLALLAVVLVEVWQGTPFFIIFLSASLDSIPEEMTEAALVEGASESQIIQYIKLPMVKPTLVIAAIMRAIDSIKTFDVVYVMTKGGPGISTELMSMYTYTVGFRWYRIGYATTIAFVFTMMISLLLGVLNKKTSIQL